jgi:hypothetical protein
MRNLVKDLSKNLIKNQSLLIGSLALALSSAGVSFAASSGPAMATQASAGSANGPTKTYEVLRLKQVVSNSEQCQGLYSALKSATEEPIALQFAPHPVKSGHFLVSDANAQLVSHEFTIVKQEVSADGSQISRVGMGSFSLNQHQNSYQVDYVIDVNADVNQANFKYIYPMLLSGVQGHCEYVALIQPDAKTIAALKNNLKAGQVSQKIDLNSK